MAEQDGDDVVISRHATNSAPPGMFAQFWPNHPSRVDKFTKMRWMAPSTLRLVTGICKMGAAPETGTGYNAIHMLTPENESSTLYHFTAVRFGVMTTDKKASASAAFSSASATSTRGASSSCAVRRRTRARGSSAR